MGSLKSLVHVPQIIHLFGDTRPIVHLENFFHGSLEQEACALEMIQDYTDKWEK